MSEYLKKLDKLKPIKIFRKIGKKGKKISKEIEKRNTKVMKESLLGAKR